MTLAALSACSTPCQSFSSCVPSATPDLTASREVFSGPIFLVPAGFAASPDTIERCSSKSFRASSLRCSEAPTASVNLFSVSAKSLCPSALICCIELFRSPTTFPRFRFEIVLFEIWTVVPKRLFDWCIPSRASSGSAASFCLTRAFSAYALLSASWDASRPRQFLPIACCA